MEKISIYTLLSLLLPGSLLTLFVVMILADWGIVWNLSELNDYYQLILFLSSAFMLGSFINMCTNRVLKWYRKLGIYTSIYNLYLNFVPGQIMESFYSSKLDLNDDDEHNYQQLESLWSEIYYELEAKEKISVPKTFQSFYFFFRNFMTLGIIALPTNILMLIFHTDHKKYFCLLIAGVIMLIISFRAAQRNREYMVERMFWTYYSLNKTAK